MIAESNQQTPQDEGIGGAGGIDVARIRRHPQPPEAVGLERGHELLTDAAQRGGSEHGGGRLRDLPQAEPDALLARLRRHVGLAVVPERHLDPGEAAQVGKGRTLGCVTEREAVAGGRPGGGGSGWARGVSRNDRQRRAVIDLPVHRTAAGVA